MSSSNEIPNSIAPLIRSVPECQDRLDPSLRTRCVGVEDPTVETDLLTPDDHEPVVVLEDETAAPAAMLGEAARAYLREQGVTDERTWAAFRLGQVDEATLERLGLTGRRRPGGSGISIPTCDPRDPATVLGVVRLLPSQNKHRFAGPAVGLAAPGDLADRPRVVLVDHPLLALRLHQAGVHEVALAEDPAVLPPLAAWLGERELLLAAHKSDGIAAMRASLGEVGTRAASVVLSATPGRLSDEMRSILGVAPIEPEPAPPITPFLLRDLHAYAEGRLQTAEGVEALRALQLADPELLRAYRFGYLPVDVRTALSPEARRAFAGRYLGNTVVVPAYDEAGAVVDLLAVQMVEAGHIQTSVWDQPRGLCAPALTTAHERLLVTDTLRWVGRLARTGRPTLLLRGPADAVANAARLAAAGVQHIEVRAHRAGAEIAQALRATGITVELRAGEADQPSVAEVAASPAPGPAAPSLAPMLELIRNDAATERAVFRFGAATITAQVPWGGNASLEVVITAGEQRHRDRLDLAAPAQRQRFASCAALRLGIPADDLGQALGALLPAVQALSRPAEPEPAASAAGPALSPADREAALVLLRADDLLERLGADLEALGWIGEPDAKALILLAAISRLCHEPLWAVLTAGTASERFPALGVLAAITPPEHLLQVSRLTDNALVHADPQGLCHKLLIIDDAAGISPTVATALRILRARGVLTGTQVERDPLRGQMRTRFVETRGPLAVITASAGPVPESIRQHLLEIPIDESPEQAERLLAARRRLLASPATGDRQRIAARMQNLQRLLAVRPVMVPEAQHLKVPPIISRNRALQDAFFGLITASAVLHQHQRLATEGCVVADVRDHAIATRLVLALAASRSADLSRQGYRLLTTLWAAKRITFTMEDLAGLLPDWTRSAFRSALAELASLDYLTSPRGVQGKRREYTLVATSSDHASRDVGDLATLGDAGSPAAIRDVANG